MSNNKKRRPLKLHPIERAILRRKWSQQGLAAELQALGGNNVDDLLGKAGSMFWVVLHATRDKAHPLNDTPERRVIRGAVNTLGDLVGATAITELQRGAVWAGLEAVQRLATAIDAYAVRKRLSEMQRDGLVEPTGETRATSSGRRERVWRLL